MKYKNKKGRIFFISDGISDGKFWGTFERKPNGSLRRIVSPYLPMRESRESAEADLTWYAKKYGTLEIVD